MYLYVYTGGQTQHSIKGHNFPQGVPCFCPDWLQLELKERADFKEYDPNKVYDSAPSTIYVNTPHSLKWLAGAILFIQRVKQMFPKSAVKCRVWEGFNGLIPEGVQSEPHYNPNDLPKYLRFFDIRFTDKQIDPMWRKSAPFHVIQLSKMGLYDWRLDKNPPINDQTEVNKGKIIIIDAVDERYAQLIEEIKAGTKHEIEVYQYENLYDVNVINELTYKIKSSAGIINLRDPEISFMAWMLKRRSYTIINQTRTDAYQLKMLGQQGAFKEMIDTAPGDVLERILNFCKEITTQKKKSWDQPPPEPESPKNVVVKTGLVDDTPSIPTTPFRKKKKSKSN